METGLDSCTLMPFLPIGQRRAWRIALSKCHALQSICSNAHAAFAHHVGLPSAPVEVHCSCTCHWQRAGKPALPSHGPALSVVAVRHSWQVLPELQVLPVDTALHALQQCMDMPSRYGPTVT